VVKVWVEILKYEKTVGGQGYGHSEEEETNMSVTFS
jgi:hypothetical protein